MENNQKETKKTSVKKVVKGKPTVAKKTIKKPAVKSTKPAAKPTIVKKPAITNKEPIKSKEEKTMDVVERLKSVLADIRGNEVPKTQAETLKEKPPVLKTAPAEVKKTPAQPAAKRPLQELKSENEPVAPKAKAKALPVNSKKTADDLLNKMNVSSEKPASETKMPLPIKEGKTNAADQPKAASTDYNRMQEIIAAQKKLKQLMESEALKAESKERSFKEKMGLTHRLEEEEPESVTIEELQKEQENIEKLNSEIKRLLAEKTELDAAIKKVIEVKFSGVPVIDPEKLSLTPSLQPGSKTAQEAEIPEVAKTISEIEEVLKTLQKKHGENLRSLEAAEKGKRDLEEKLTKQTAIVNQLEKEIASLRGEVLKGTAKSANLEAKAEAAPKTDAKLLKENESLKAQLEKAKNNLAAIRAAAKAEMNEKLSGISKQFQDKSKESLKLQKEIETLRKDIEIQKGKEEQIKASYLNGKKEEARLKKEIEVVKLSTLKEKNLLMKGDNAEALLATNAQYQETKRENAKLQQQIEKLKNDLNNNFVLRDEKVRAAKEAEKAKLEAEKAKERIQKELEERNKTFEPLKVKEAEERFLLAAEEKEKQRLADKLQALREKTEASKLQDAENKKLFDAEKREKNKLAKRIEKMKADKKNLQTVIRDYKKLDETQAAKDLENAQILQAEKDGRASVDKELEQLRLEVDGLVSSINELRQTNEALRSHADEENLQIPADEQSLQADFARMKEENALIGSALEEQKAVNSKLKEQIKNQSSDRVKQLEQELNSKNDDLDAVREENRRLQTSLNDLSQYNEALQSQASLGDGKTENPVPASVSEETAQLRENNDRLIASFNDLNLALELLKNKYADLEKAYEAEKNKPVPVPAAVVSTRDDQPQINALIGELKQTQELLKSRDLEMEILKSNLFREQNRINYPEPYKMFNYENLPCGVKAPGMAYAQPYPNAAVQPTVAPDDRQEKDALQSEIRVLKAEIEKLKQTPADPSQLIREFREELNRNREELRSLSSQKQKEMQEIAETYETKLQTNENEKAALVMENDEKMQEISSLQDQVANKDSVLQNMKNTMKQFSEDDILDPEFKRRIRVIRDMQREIKNRLAEEEEANQNSSASLQTKITQRQQDIEKLNSRIDQLSDSFNSTRDFTATTKEAFEKARAKALLELQLQEERLGELEEDLARITAKYQNFVATKQQEMANLKTKEGQIIDYYLRKIRQDYALTENSKEVQQVESERNQLMDQLNELKMTQEKTSETIAKQSEELSKVLNTNQNLQTKLIVDRKAAIEKEARLLEEDIREQSMEYNNLVRKLTDLKTELDKRLDYEKKLRNNEEEVSDFYNNKLFLGECLSEYNSKTKQMEEIQAKIDSLGNDPAMKTELLKAKAEVTDLEVHRDDLRSKIDFSKKNLKDLEGNEAVMTYVKLVSQIDQIKTVVKDLRDQAEPLKEKIQAKNKELDALMKEKSEIV
jgi:hypothetical protein